MTKKIILAVLSTIIGTGIGLRVTQAALSARDAVRLPVGVRKLVTASVVTTVASLNPVNNESSRGRAKVDIAPPIKVERDVVSNNSLPHVRLYFVDQERS